MRPGQLGDQLFAEAAVVGALQAALIELVAHHRLRQGLQEDQQGLGHRVVTTRDGVWNAGVQTVKDILQLLLQPRGQEQVLLLAGLGEEMVDQ